MVFFLMVQIFFESYEKESQELSADSKAHLEMGRYYVQKVHMESQTV